ncbi:unnamed protein product [Absidia cylindrospora]
MMPVSYKYRLPYIFAIFSLFFLYRFIHLDQEIRSPSVTTDSQQEEPSVFLEQESFNSLEQQDSKASCQTNNVERNTDPNHNNAHLDFWMNLPQETIQTYQAQWQQFIEREMKKPSPTQKTFKGSGIVLVAGNGDTFTRALTTIKLLRNYGCSLPIDVWHLNDEQPTVEMAKELNDLQAQPRDLSNKNLIRPIDERKGGSKQFQIKVAAIINSGFEHILYLDSDNIPTTDPTFLFDHPAYLKTGAIFWPDFWKTHEQNSIFDILGVDCTDEWEQESGQMVINKIKSWHPLQLAWYMNDHHDLYYQFLNGDKDTFRFAWKALKVPYYMNPNYLGMGGTLTDNRFCGHTMIQYPPPPFSSDEEEMTPLFVHANLLKITDKVHFLQQDGVMTERPWQWIKRYPKGTKTTWLLPKFYVNGFSRPCMDFSSAQGEPQTELEPFDSVVSGLQRLYFDFGGIGGETRD